MRCATVLSVAAMAKVVVAGLYPGITTDNHTCEIVKPVLSCTSCADPGLVDTCCTETFGGLVLLTQFWTVYTNLEEQGQVLPKYSWSIHGLWPDFCNGSYTQYCDLGRQYDPHPSPNTTNGKPDGTPVPPYKGESIANWFEPYGKLDLLAYMNKYWISRNEPNWILWAHEYSKHATCFSTFQTECYGPKAAPLDDLFDYFQTTVKYDRTLPTYKWLQNAGIVPSNSTTYTLSAFQEALAAGFGGETPYLGCSGSRYNETAAGKGSLDNGRTELSEVWYYYHVYGRPQDGNAKKVPADVVGGSVTNCAKAEKAIKYYERSKGSEA